MELSSDNLVGKIFNNWKVISFHEKRGYSKYFWCECLLCHQVKSIYISSVIQGKSNSCGCISRGLVAYNINKKRNDFIVEGAITKIFITSPCDGVMLIDTDDFDKLANLYIRLEIQHNNYYAIATKDYTILRIHRYLLGVIDSNISVDHINGNTLDNRKSNLRLCSFKENNWNKVNPNRNNTSGYRGVSYDKSRDRWVGVISCNGNTYRKRFKTKEEAHLWYVEMNRSLFGEFSGFNR